ncbi:hypothetical protein [Paraburkholderia graminis]|uniref:hypothetical protein n=1 Tax=Paraburkholderia graminis TaxID=60548 RepID=UPI001ABF17D5|nr:hypothetical protein [Paraburkholderia graminis]
MAGISGLPYFLQYEQQAQQQTIQRQQAAMQMAAFQQQQQDRQRQQAALAAAGNALPGLLAGQQQSQQIPPPPGQASQPAQPTQPMQSPQGMQPQGSPMPSSPMSGPTGIPPLPSGAPSGSIPQQGIPPFRPMPTGASPAQAASPASIPAPPSPAPQQQGGGGPLTLEGAVKVLQDQGLSGADLMAGLQQLQPVLDSQAKQQAAHLQAQFNNEMKLQQLGVQRESLQARIDAAKQASEDRRLGIQERMQAHQDSVALQREMFAFRVQEAKMKHAGDPDAKLDPDTVRVLAEQALAGDTSVYQNLGRGVQGAQNIVAIRKEVARMAKERGEGGADIAAGNAQFQGDKAAARTAGTRAANVELAANEAKKTSQIALDLSEKIPRTQFVPVNKALQAAQTNTGDPNIVAFGAANNTFINTYARAISPTGTPTVHDKEHAREVLSTAQTQEQYRSVMSVLQKEMDAALQAPKDVRKSQRDRMAGKGGESAGGIPSGWSVTEH